MKTALKNHFLNLYLIALSDHHFDEKELETILKIGEEKGISKAEFEKIIIAPTTSNISIPDDFIDKIKLLYDFARVIWSDQVIEPEEKQSFLNFCSKFGFESNESIELFDWLIGLAKQNLNTDQLEVEITNLIQD